MSDLAQSVARPEGELEAMRQVWDPPRGFAALSAVNQTPMGKRFLVTGFVFFLIGGLMALLMRTQLAVPENDFLGHQLYNQLFTMHGTTMLFLFAVPILEGAAIYLIPLLIGARDMAFPRLSAFGYWCYLFGGILLYSSLLFGLMPDTGWTMYTPLSTPEFSPEKRVDFWLLGITLVEIGSITAAAEIAVTILKSRAPGMSLNRMPLFAWYMLVVSFMILFGFPPLIMGDLLLELERTFNWPFFDAARGGHNLLWQHLFWLFGHPEVYIIFLPAAGMVSMIIATFCQRPTVGYFWLVTAAVGTGFVSFGLWVHHMFVTGIPLISLGWFSSASMTVAIFSGIQIFAWLATLWLGRPLLKTPMLFVAGFIFLFVAGGLSGVMHAVIPFDWQNHSTYFLVAHFHYVLFGGMVFPLFAAFYYWFPAATGKMMSETLGKWNFWLMFVGFNLAFFPMHISGLEGMPRRVYTYPEGMWEWENLLATLGSYLLAFSIALFIVNFVRSLRRGEPAGVNPWNAGTLDFAVPTPIPSYNFRSIPQVRSLYPLWDQPNLADEINRGEHLLPTPVGGLRLALATTSVTATPESIIVLPKPTWIPLVTAIGLALFFIGVLVERYWLTGAGGALSLAALLLWQWKRPEPNRRDCENLERDTGIPVDVSGSAAFGWWGMLFAVLGDASLFLSLVFAYFYLWTNAPLWPPAGTEPFALGLPLLGILGFIAGSVLLRLGSRRDARRLQMGSFAGCALLALALAALQGYLLADSGLSPQRHAYDSLVFTLLSFLLLHLAIALVMMGFALAEFLRMKSSHTRDHTLSIMSLWWHYVMGLGVVTSLVVYLSPALLG